MFQIDFNKFSDFVMDNQQYSSELFSNLWKKGKNYKGNIWNVNVPLIMIITIKWTLVGIWICSRFFRCYDLKAQNEVWRMFHQELLRFAAYCWIAEYCPFFIDSIYALATFRTHRKTTKIRWLDDDRRLGQNKDEWKLFPNR